jgi:hypothetical protein
MLQRKGGMFHDTLPRQPARAGLICGSELNVAVFAHPTLNRQPLETHILMRASFARLFGPVMPFWMAGSTLLNLLLLMPYQHLGPEAWRLALIAFAIQALAIPFSLFGPVPINNRIINWTPESLPNDWKQHEHRWDMYHWLQTFGLIVAFGALIRSAMIRRLRRKTRSTRASEPPTRVAASAAAQCHSAASNKQSARSGQ